MHRTSGASRSASVGPTHGEVALPGRDDRMPSATVPLPLTRDGERRPLLVTVDEAAHMLRIGRTVVYQLMQEGEIRSVKIGRNRRVVATSIGEYISRLLNQPD